MLISRKDQVMSIETAPCADTTRTQDPAVHPAEDRLTQALRTVANSEEFEGMMARHLAATHELIMTSMEFAISYTKEMEEVPLEERFRARNARNEHSTMAASMLDKFHTSHLHLLSTREMLLRLRHAGLPPASSRRTRRGPAA